jgi:hypothetical protein
MSVVPRHYEQTCFAVFGDGSSVILPTELRIPQADETFYLSFADFLQANEADLTPEAIARYRKLSGSRYHVITVHTEYRFTGDAVHASIRLNVCRESTVHPDDVCDEAMRDALGDHGQG